MNPQNQQFPLLWHSFSIVAALLLFSVAPNSMISAQAAENLYLPVVTNALINQDGCCLNEQEAQL